MGGGYTTAGLCCWQNKKKQILMKGSGIVGKGPRKRRMHFGDVPNSSSLSAFLFFFFFFFWYDVSHNFTVDYLS